MVTLDKLRLDMKSQFEIDRSIRYVDVKADSMDEALSDAAIQLDSRIGLLEYEILDPGYKGFMGLMKKPWFLRVYENPKLVKKSKKKYSSGGGTLDESEESLVIQDIDGFFFVRRFGSQIHLKVVAPVGEGMPVDFEVVMDNLQDSDILSIDENLVKQFVANTTNGEYEPVGEYQHDQVNDATFFIDISADEMKANIVATAASIGGADISYQRIEKMLGNQGLQKNIVAEKVIEFVDNPVYGMPVTVAEGREPIDGRDAYIAYRFETDKSKLRLNESESGQVDFKELNRVQNVVEGQPLAEKILPERGKNGLTLYGRFLEAKNGKDIALPVGKNVQVDTDGRTIIASVSGQVLLVNDKINVEPIMELDGINIKTGNITFLGTIIVKGNVEDGFTVKASGNIEIYGTVGSSNLEADGNIIVSLGIMGKDTAVIKSGDSIWAKFIQNATVEAENFVIVRDGIINANTTSNKKILVKGKRGSIIGGNSFATEEIRAKNIGSSAGANETILSVGFDPRAKKRLDELQERQSKSLKEQSELALDIKTLEDQKKIRRNISAEKQETLAALQVRNQELYNEIDEMSQEIQGIQAHLRELKIVGTVSASGAVYPGVKIYIRDVKEEVRNETKSVTFVYEDGFIRYGKYIQNDEDEKLADGNTTN